MRERTCLPRLAGVLGAGNSRGEIAILGAVQSGADSPGRGPSEPAGMISGLGRPAYESQFASASLYLLHPSHPSHSSHEHLGRRPRCVPQFKSHRPGGDGPRDIACMF